MTISEITILANNYTDETMGSNVVLGFANTAISRINTELKTILPLFNDVEEYTALGVDYIHTIVVPYVCWAIKMNDGSLNEARMYEYQFKEGIEILRVNKRNAVDPVYMGSGSNNMHIIKPYTGMSRGSRTKASSMYPLGDGFKVKEEDD